jgi:hypothetical protein
MRLPWYSVSRLVKSSRTASMYARKPARVTGCSPRLRIALSPEPRPKIARPGAISSTVAIAEAETAGWRVIGLVTVGPIRTRRVAWAQSALTA